MQGRYGPDKLGMVLAGAGLGVSVLSWFLSKAAVAYSACRVLSILLWGYAVYRMFSRNYAARQRELAGYQQFESKLRALWQKVRYGKQNIINLRAEHKRYKRLNCPQCLQKLRVPRGKGKLLVTCSKCGCKFTAKS
jgi:hypothetical protein